MLSLVTQPAFYLLLGISQDGITTILTITQAGDCSRLRVDSLTLLIFIGTSVILGFMI